jgi:hypothetical protein
MWDNDSTALKLLAENLVEIIAINGQKTLKKTNGGSIKGFISSVSNTIVSSDWSLRSEDWITWHCGCYSIGSSVLWSLGGASFLCFLGFGQFLAMCPIWSK